MKHFYQVLFFGIVCLILSVKINAQVPQKFNYQAVARNNNAIIANGNVGLRLTITDGNGGATLYQETQTVSTNLWGIFSLQVGSGAVVSGSLSGVQWKDGNKWLQVEMDPNGSTSYTNMGSTELVSVPYALHSEGAWIINGSDISNPNSGAVNIINGNLSLNDNEIRLRNSGDGNHVLRYDPVIDGPYLTGNNGGALGSPSGHSIEWGNNGDARAFNNLYVNNSLVVDDFHLNTGTTTNTLKFGSGASGEAIGSNRSGFGNNQNGLDFYAGSGAKRMAILNDGKVGIGTDTPSVNLEIVNNTGSALTKISGSTNAGLTLNAQSNNGSSFIDFIKNGSGVAQITYAPNFKKFIIVASNAGPAFEIATNGNTGVTDNFLTHPIDTTDALFTIKGAGKYAGNHIALFENTGNTDADGIAIKIDNGTTNSGNKFITFLNQNGDVKGRIEGFSLANGDWIAPPEPLPYDPGSVNLNINPNSGSTQWFFPPSLSINNSNLSLHTNNSWCFAAGVCAVDGVTIGMGNFNWTTGGFDPTKFIADPPIYVTPPQVGSGIADSIAAYICWELKYGFGDIALSLNPWDVAVKTIKENALKACNEGGVTYGSHGADYAEYIEKSDPSEYIQAFDIVGIKGGKVSRNTIGAEQIMIVSNMPVVLGNTPKEGEEKNYVTCGFMGQLPCVVRGLCHKGDYILTSGLNDGTAIAIAPENLTLNMLNRIVGRAWADQTNEIYGLVNVAIGLKTNEWIEIFKQQEEKLSLIQDQYNNLNDDVKQIKSMLGLNKTALKLSNSASLGK